MVQIIWLWYHTVRWYNALCKQPGVYDVTVNLLCISSRRYIWQHQWWWIQNVLRTDLMHKSHKAPYPTIHHFVTEMCTILLQNGALWDICMMHCGIWEMGLLYTRANIVVFLCFDSNHCSSWFIFFGVTSMAKFYANVPTSTIIWFKSDPLAAFMFRAPRERKSNTRVRFE